MTKRIISVAAFTLIAGCGGQSGNGTASTNPGAGGGSLVGGGGSSAGSVAQGGAGAGGAGMSIGGATTGGGGGASAAGAGAMGGLGGSGGGAGTCPDYQSGFSGGPAMPELAPEGPSCAGGLTCAGRSCCEAVRVKGGPMKLGAVCTQGCGDPDSWCPPPLDVDGEVPIQVTDTTIDTFPVTVGRFRGFVTAYTGAPIPAGAGADPNVPKSGWRDLYNMYTVADATQLRKKLSCDPTRATWTDNPGPNEDKAINCVDWFDAFAFCIWDGGWLPIEAQWEYVAKGGSEDRKYPWGQPEPDLSLVAPSICTPQPGSVCNLPISVAVGSRPAGRGKWGHYDLQGYVGQWMQDVQHPYTKMPGTPGFPIGGCNGGGGGSTGSTTGVDCFSWEVVVDGTPCCELKSPVVRGDGDLGYSETFESLRSALRSGAAITGAFPNVGVRCARHLELVRDL